MKRRSSLNKKAIASQSLLIASGLASLNTYAMVPVNFGNWSVDGSGTITAICPSSYQCTVEISDKNFYQEVMRETDINGNILPKGKIFFRQVISENDMVNESIVRANNLASTLQRHGIANSQSFDMSQITENADTNFSTSTTMYSGWASTEGTPDLQIGQSIGETSRKAGEGGVYLEGSFNSATAINANYDIDGNRSGFSFALDQSMSEPGEYGGGSSGGKNSPPVPGTYNGIDEQVFTIRGLAGDLLTSGGSLTLNGSTLSWNEHDDLWAVALGQNFHHSELTGFGSQQQSDNSTAGWQDLGMMFESYDNRSDTVDAVNYFAYFENNTLAWPSVFGATPVLPASTGFNGDETTTAAASPPPTLATSLFTPTAVGPEQADGRDAPIDFGQWTVVDETINAQGVLGDLVDPSASLVALSNWTTGDDGTILPECSEGLLCETGNVDAPGMTQRIIIDDQERRYIQTIITDLTSGFTTESFVSVASPGTLVNYSGYGGASYTGGYNESSIENGIALKMVMSQDTSLPNLTQVMDSEINIATGWAARTGTPNVNITQNMDSTGFNAMQHSQHFSYSGNLDADGNTIGSMVDIDQTDVNLLNQYQMTPQTAAGLNSDIKFTHRSRSGNLQTTSGSVPDVMTWGIGDAIAATNILLNFDGGATDGWGVTFYDNLVDNLGVVDVGFLFEGYTGVGSDWISSAFGTAPIALVSAPTSGGGGNKIK